MRRLRPSSITVYVAAVTLLGLALFGYMVERDLDTVRDPSPEFIVLFAFVVLGEMLSITVRRQNRAQDEITTSITFSFALVLSYGIAAGILAQAIASILGDTVRRKPPSRVLFNIGQYTLALCAAGGVLLLLDSQGVAGIRDLGPRDFFAIVIAAGTFFLVNGTLTNIAIALSEHIPIAKNLGLDVRFQGFIDAILLGLSPIVVVAAQTNLLLVPLLTLPMAAVARSAKAALEKEELIDQLRFRAAENEHQALHDALTGLPNRTLFRDRLQQSIRAAKRDNGCVGVMIMDLDRFKEINDTLGHHNGDLVLQQVGSRLRETLRESDTIARLGGDEFAVLTPDVSGSNYAMLTASKILKSLERVFTVGDLALDIGASIGVAVFPHDGEDADELIQRSDVAMYAAKQNHAGFAQYSPGQNKYSPERLALVGELRQAFEEDELVNLYQPKARLADGFVTGVEALVRWRHPRHGLMAPSKFIPLAEHTGLIRPLTLNVLGRALWDLHEWDKIGLRLSVSVNLSVQNLLDSRLANEVSRLLEKWNIAPPRLELEITESSIMADPTRAMAVLTELSQMGIGLAIDDFGTGYSSLAYLKQLPVQAIKIDKSFVTGMTRNENDAVIVRSTVDLGRNLGLEVIAEGVETQEIWDALVGLDTSVAQGFFLGRPMGPEKIPGWMRQWETVGNPYKQGSEDPDPGWSGTFAPATS
jgi:diguanylate cyclase (GGDEF)-like protein